jgi:hypothetical protein
MKYIRQGLQFHWFCKHATILGKILSEIKLGLRSNSTNITSSNDFLLIYIMLLDNVKH